MASIEETVDVLDAAISCVEKVVELRADGSISLVDGIQLAIAEAPEFIKAFAGADQIPEELKDLDSSEIKVLAEKGVALAKAVMALFGSK